MILPPPTIGSVKRQAAVVVAGWLMRLHQEPVMARLSAPASARPVLDSLLELLDQMVPQLLPTLPKS